MAGEIYEPGQRVPCPHCGTTVRLDYATSLTPSPMIDGDEHVVCSRISVQNQPNPVLRFAACPQCRKCIVQIEAKGKWWLVVPRVGFRKPVHADVPANLRDDYGEAALVLNDSPKASAALSRRCLQALLLDQGAKKRDLQDQLEELRSTVPQYVQPYIDNVRKLGNISAHAKQSMSTGEIVDVEPGEADWMLELLEELFDHYYAKPAAAKAKHDALSRKLADAGKLRVQDTLEAPS